MTKTPHDGPTPTRSRHGYIPRVTHDGRSVMTPLYADSQRGLFRPLEEPVEAALANRPNPGILE